MFKKICIFLMVAGFIACRGKNSCKVILSNGEEVEALYSASLRLVSGQIVYLQGDKNEELGGVRWYIIKKSPYNGDTTVMIEDFFSSTLVHYRTGVVR